MSEMLFGTVGSPKSTPLKPGGSVGAISRIAALGLQALELAWVQSVRVSESTCQAIKTAGIQNNIKISVHAPYYINLNAAAEEWPKSKKRIIDAAYFGFLAGATDIVFHPGTYFGNPPSEVLAIAIPRLADCVAELKKKKVKVTLRAEVMGKSAMLGSLEDALEMSKQIPGVAPCMDFAHLHARPGDGSMNTYEEWSKVLEKYHKALGDTALKNMHIHLSGIEYSAKGERNHLMLSEADLDIHALFNALKAFDAGGRIMCESPVLEDDALILQKIWGEV